MCEFYIFSVGGYGALLLTLKNPHMFVSTSLLAPICDYVSAPRCQDAFERYLGKDRSKWLEWSVFHALENYNGPPLQFLIDQVSDSLLYLW